MLIRLPARIEDDLLWKVEPTSSVIWELDFGVLSEEPMVIQAALLAADHFCTFWRAHEAQTAGVAIYRGSLEEMPLDLFYRIAERLPDELPIFLLLESRLGRLKLAQRLSQLGSFQVAMKRSAPWIWQDNCIWKAPRDEKVGICLPESLEGLDRLERVCDRLDAEKIRYRILSETFLTESWEGLDQLYVCSDRMTAKGHRKLMGFRAAGGEVEEAS